MTNLNVRIGFFRRFFNCKVLTRNLEKTILTMFKVSAYKIFQQRSFSVASMTLYSKLKMIPLLPKFEIDKYHLIETIHETANRFGANNRWGDDENETGVGRLALSDDDKGVRDWFVSEAKELGCEVKVDELGNIFATYKGKNEGAPTAIGSHLDTQPTGGRYDGVYGVLSGLEVLRTLKRNNYVPNFPIAVVSWTNEEGARFPQSCCASATWAGSSTKEKVYDLASVTDKLSVTFGEELKRIGYLGSVPCDHEQNPLAAHFELHIEQGPILEQTGKKIGCVQGIQGLKWLEIVIKGEARHTGTTPFSARSDALLASSNIILKGNEIAIKHGGLFSVGVLDIKPAVANVIPHEVRLIADWRHPDDHKMSDMNAEFMEAMNSIINKTGKNLKVNVNEMVTQAAVSFDQTCIDCVKLAAIDSVGLESMKDISSGANHDSGLVSGICPTAMIFIPSRDGISHHPEEFSTVEQVNDGFKVLLGAVLKYDLLRTD